MKEEQGTVILLFALLSVVLAGFAALSVDLYQAATVRDQLTASTQMASLGAVEKYYASASVSNQDERIEGVVNRVEEVFLAQLGEGSPLLERYEYDSGGKRELDGNMKDIIKTGLKVVFQEHDDNFDPVGTTDYDEIVIHAGNYIYSEEQYDLKYGSLAKPDGCDEFPCFAPARPTDTISTFKVLSNFPDFGYGGFINSVADGAFERLSLKSTAVSSVVPRIGCFLVDISPSASRQTHHSSYSKQVTDQLVDPDGYAGASNSNNPYQKRDLDVPAGHGAMPAYVLSKYNPQIDVSYDDAGDCSKTSPPAPTASEADWDAWVNEINTLTDFGLFTPMECKYTTRGSDTRAYYHYESDYTVKQVAGDSVYSSFDSDLHPNPLTNPMFSMGDTGLFHSVQTYRGPTFQGPEPFKTIMDGLAFAVERFKERNVSGDKLCLIFYDEYVGWARTVQPTSDLDYILKLVKDDNNYVISADDYTTSGHVADIKPDDATGWLERSIRHGLFPGYVRAPDTTVPSGERLVTDTKSNLPQAIMAASNFIHDAAEGGPSSAFITLFGDGLTNCRFDGDCSDDFGCNCSNDFNGHTDSISDLYDLAAELVEDKNIPIHVFLMGDSVNPHIIYHYEDGTGSCLSEEQIRGLPSQNSFVKGNEGSTAGELETAFDLKDDATVTGDNRWYQTNTYLYNLARLSRGIWAPILPATDSDGLCVPYDTVCADTAGRPPHRSRRLEDPLCESAESQVQRYIDQIIGDNPFVVVETE